MLEKARAIEPQLVAWRRLIHHHPELGFQELHTAAKAAAILEDLGCRVRTAVGKTGVVGDLGEGRPRIAIRADMDALPILEANQVAYASENPGIMHACGHDAHTAMVLGVAALLAKETLPGSVRFFIQPSEEANDSEGLSGAMRMVDEGAMEGDTLVFEIGGKRMDVAGTSVSFDTTIVMGKPALWENMSSKHVRLALPVSSIEGKREPGGPGGFQLEQNHPNPFNSRTVIRFSVPGGREFRLTLFDVNGRVVRLWTGKSSGAGGGEVVWNGRDERGIEESSGVFLIRLESGTSSMTRKCLYIK